MYLRLTNNNSMTMCFFGFGYHWRKFGREMLNDYGSYSICPRENRRAVGSIAVAQSVVGEIAVYRHGPWFSMPSQSLSGLSLNVGEIVLAQSATYSDAKYLNAPCTSLPN